MSIATSLPSVLALAFGALLALASARSNESDDEASAGFPSNVVTQAPAFNLAGQDDLRDALPLDAQRCNSECQERFSNCLLACDGKNRCMQGCKQTVAACAEGCSKQDDAPSGSGGGAPTAPSSTAPSSSASGTASSAPSPKPPPTSPAPTATAARANPPAGAAPSAK